MGESTLSTQVGEARGPEGSDGPEPTRMLATMLASALPGKSTCPQPRGLSGQPRECPEGLAWHRGWWSDGGEGGLEPGESSGAAPSAHGDLSLPRGPRPWVLSCLRPTC